MRIPDKALDASAWMLENGHRVLLKLSGGRYPRSVMGMKTVELFTTGRKSGNVHGTLLTSPLYAPDRVVLVASRGGAQDHPDWYKNLVVTPDVELVVDDRRRAMRARTADSAERAALWPQVVRAYKGYGQYQLNTDREIPVVVCEARKQA